MARRCGLLLAGVWPLCAVHLTGAFLAGTAPAVVRPNSFVRRTNWHSALPAGVKELGLCMTSSSSSGNNIKKGANNLVQRYMQVLESKPLLTKSVTSGVVCLSGDVLCQLLTAGSLGALRYAFDLKRAVMYGSMGALYLAPLAHYWYGVLDKKVATPKEAPTDKQAARADAGAAALKEKMQITEEQAAADDSIATAHTATPKRKLGKQQIIDAVKMVFVDQAIASPIVNGGFLLVYGLCMAAASGGGGGLGGIINGGVSKVRAALWPTLVASWKIWPAANFFNFLLVPPQLRVLYLNVVGVAWNIVMSTIANG